MWSPKIAALVAAIFCGMATVQASTYKPARPPAVPLAVRTPYLSSWLQCEPECLLPDNWPRHWTTQILGWQGLVAVDGKVFNWMGKAFQNPVVNQLSLEYTSTKSIFIFDVDGKVNLSVTFLSPVFADDLSRQSQQFSYISAKAKSSDGGTHDVRLYMDVSGEWASGDVSQKITWAHNTTNKLNYHTFQRTEQVEYGENGEIAAWGRWYFTTGSDSGLSWQIGSDQVVRSRFASNQTLANTVDDTFRAVQDNWPVFGFSHNLGDVGSSETERLFTLGLIQDNVIHFAGMNKTLDAVPGLWQSYFNRDDRQAIEEFYGDYQYAATHSNELDDRIQQDSVKAGGQDYATITTLTVRQSFGALQFGGTPSKPYIFLKEISSNSDIQTVDVIFPAYPILLYLNATLAKYLLDPLFENQESGAYPNKWAEHDLGTFPVAKGYPSGNDEPMPLEECGNMVIMTLAYAERTGDTGYLQNHYSILSQWAEFLVEDSLIPSNQLSTDDFAGTLANQTNLAIKGIIGLKAMGRIANLTSNSDNWGAIADEYLENWKVLAINNDTDLPHTTLSYGDKNSHGLLYNIYADKLLDLNFVDQSIFDMQSKFYQSIALKYAVPLDTRHTWTKSDWMMFAAAVAGPDTKELLINKLANWIGNTTTNRAMTDLYDAETGGYPQNGPTFVARPVMGGTFALLALPF
ncbi:hypothetical protein SMACR_06286 [Sordaria macrospora]|uniref:WGS project CABT00000000 data, contig 2.34 n=2 Tax=Sordaria macrospora TaxID=5147 RepID=F7W6C9_SORMK|nr:uncharacterized protein SMAC_06286 [Sordaria macrospora k-hell]KAA8635223.1 hypothetical protein SMACR_06286 [Sordaria macrospora]KAH7630438.1 hypothetical protein B0T09DRAFT_357988 [Sordaria sp. MPI-SDFR-AT-0083]WPJ67104.1 hypothetical protein SMAC4_06286 [Sordaria macrospora]CCC13068.1 unnamed protein product [Sordaria macrospora k-hell]